MKDQSEDCDKIFLDISQKKFGSAYAQSPRKCSNIEIMAKIEGIEAKFFSKIYEGHIRIRFRSKKNSKLSHACVPLIFRCMSGFIFIFVRNKNRIHSLAGVMYSDPMGPSFAAFTEQCATKMSSLYIRTVGKIVWRWGGGGLIKSFSQ